jgi:hypothetical protein
MNALRYGRFALLAAILFFFGVSYGWLRTATSEQRANAAKDVDAKKRSMAPRQVLIIRHAEKPEDDTDIHLASRGAARAAALPSLFVIPPTFPTKPAAFATPEVIFAAKQSKYSNRSVETVTPLARALADLPIDHQRADKAFRVVVDDLFGDAKHTGKTILICWHHGNIPDLALAVIAKAKNASQIKGQVPQRWGGSVFDRVWVITFDDAGNATFDDRPQRLLFGDAKK